MPTPGATPALRATWTAKPLNRKSADRAHVWAAKKKVRNVGDTISLAGNFISRGNLDSFAVAVRALRCVCSRPPPAASHTRIQGQHSPRLYRHFSREMHGHCRPPPPTPAAASLSCLPLRRQVRHSPSTPYRQLAAAVLEADPPFDASVDGGLGDMPWRDFKDQHKWFGGRGSGSGGSGGDGGNSGSSSDGGGGGDVQAIELPFFPYTDRHYAEDEKAADEAFVAALRHAPQQPAAHHTAYHTAQHTAHQPLPAARAHADRPADRLATGPAATYAPKFAVGPAAAADSTGGGGVAAPLEMQRRRQRRSFALGPEGHVYRVGEEVWVSNGVDWVEAVITGFSATSSGDEAPRVDLVLAATGAGPATQGEAWAGVDLGMLEPMRR